MAACCILSCLGCSDTYFASWPTCSDFLPGFPLLLTNWPCWSGLSQLSSLVQGKTKIAYLRIQTTASSSPSPGVWQQALSSCVHYQQRSWQQSGSLLMLICRAQTILWKFNDAGHFSFLDQQSLLQAVCSQGGNDAGAVRAASQHVIAAFLQQGSQENYSPASWGALTAEVAEICRQKGVPCEVFWRN
jgi:hypothetical protein